MIPLRAYLHLRRLLLWRLLREIGGLRLALLVPVLVCVLGQALVLAASHRYWVWAVPGFVASTLASAHRQRADIRFLATSAPAYRRWLAVEYGIWALPVAGVLVGFVDWGAAVLTLALAAAVAALPCSRWRWRQPWRRCLRSAKGAAPGTAPAACFAAKPLSG